MPRVRCKIVLAETLLVIALTAAAGAARLYSLADSPAGLQGDEAWLGMEARRILDEGSIGVWTPAAWGQPAGVFYWTAVFFEIFGDSPAVLRASISVLGVATVPAMYLFIRSWYGPRAALIGTGLLVGGYWHTHFSRTAYPLTAVPLIESLVLFLLAVGWKRRSWWPFAIAGLIAGLGVHTYRGYAFFLPVLALIWVAVLVSPPYSRRTLARHAVVFLVPAVAAAMPLIMYVAENPEDYADYSKVVSVFGNGDVEAAVGSGTLPEFVGKRLLHGIEIYFVGGEPDFTDGTGTRALLDPLTAVLFAAGLAVSLIRIQDRRGLLIAAGVLSGVTAVALTVDWGAARRSIVALPMLFAAAGVAGSELMRLSGRRMAPRVNGTLRLPGALQPRSGVLWPQVAVALAVLVTATAFNGWLYTQRLLDSKAMRFAYPVEMTDVSEYVRSVPDAYVYFYSDRWSWDYETRRFLAPDTEGEDRSSKFANYSLGRRHQRPVVFLLMGSYLDQVPALERRYPDGELVERTRDGEPTFSAYLVDVPDGGSVRVRDSR